MTLINELVREKIRNELRDIVNTLLDDTIIYTRDELNEIIFAKKSAGYALFCKETAEYHQSSKDLTRKCASIWKDLSATEKIEYTRRAHNH